MLLLNYARFRFYCGDRNVKNSNITKHATADILKKPLKTINNKNKYSTSTVTKTRNKIKI